MPFIGFLVREGMAEERILTDTKPQIHDTHEQCRKTTPQQIYFQITENQRLKKKKILKEVNGNRILLHLLKNKDKNYVQLLKNHASKKETDRNI